MLFDPDAGRSTEEIILHKWNHEWSTEYKAIIEGVAAQRGCTWWDVVIECIDQFVDDLQDPIQRARFQARYDAGCLPCGPDPLLQRQDGAP